MSSTYDGVPANIAFPAAITISSSTNASPIAVTTSSPHGLLSGARVSIYGHQVNTAANGANLTITRTGASSFTINGSTGNGIGAATGTVQALNYGAITTIPSDGDLRNAASVNVPLESLFDRTAIDLPTIGAHKLAQRTVFAYADITNAAWAVISANLTSGTQTQLTAQAVVWNTIGPGTSPVATQPAVFIVPNLAFGDFVDVRINSTLVTPGASRLIWQFGAVSPGTAAPTWPGGYSGMTCSIGVGSALTWGVQLRGVVNGITFSPSGGGGSIYITPVLLPSTTGTQTHTLEGDTVVSVDVWRATGVPQ